MSAFSNKDDKNNSMPKSIVDTLKLLFPNIDLIFERVTYGGLISVFIVDILTEKILQQRWTEISSAIAANYQSHLDSDFERWNIYIIYKCREKVNLSLSYKIENDKFSSRKIVHIVEEDDYLLNNILITKYITHADLEIDVGKEHVSQVEYVSHSKIWKFISNGKIKVSRNSNKEVNSVLEQIEIDLDNEN